ncbi:MAG: ZIP family metal transporter [Desulfurococcales archaeon]|nr:ZIP family metal transporter [Desulfurococcales archaeon]
MAIALVEFTEIALIPALLTALGSLPVLLFSLRTSGRHLYPIGMGFSAGIMLVASFTSLLLPALDMGGVVMAIPGLIVGASTIWVLDRMLPHIHTEDRYEGPSIRVNLSKMWLVSMAIIIHNIPEGMAVGSAATYSWHDGLSLALAIGIQDIPEGLAVAIPIALAYGSRIRGFGVGILSGLSEFLAAYIPFLTAFIIPYTLPLLMAFSAGAMVYVVIHEITPDVIKDSDRATLGFFTGFVIMLVLDSISL